MKKKSFGIIALIIGMLMVCCTANSIGAQETEADEFMLEEITVTAQKRSENQQKVAMAMEVVSSEELSTSGKNSLDEILSNIGGGAIIGMDEDGLRISLRGMGDASTSYNGQSSAMPTVALNTDGVYSNRRDTSSGLFDLERVEVLYGPQSTMYASNSPGGIVNVITASPKLGLYEGSGSVEIGNYDTLTTQGVLNVPLGETVAIRAAYSTSTHDGYLADGTNDEDIKSLRLRTLYEPNDAFSIVVTGELGKSSGHYYGNVAQFEDEGDLDDPWYTEEEESPPSWSENRKLYARMDLDLGFAALSFLPSYAETEGYEVQVDSEMGTTKQNTEGDEKGAELRLSSSEGSSLTWIVGVNYYEMYDMLDQLTYEDGALNGESRYGTLEEESKAIFANATYPVTETLRATVGYRLSWDDIDVYRTEVMRQNSTTFREELVDWESEYSEPDYKLGVEYDLNESSMLYADYSTSYRAQAMSSEVSSSISVPPPEKLNAYTLGAKNRFFENKLQVNVEAFYYDYQNYFVQEIKTAYIGDTDADTYWSSETERDPNSSSWGDGYMMGIDVHATTVITPKDIVNLSVSYLTTEWDNLYIDYYYDVAVTSEEQRGVDLYEVEIGPMEDADYAGKEMTHSPEWTINGSYNHTFNLPNGGGLETEIAAIFKSGYRLTWDADDYPYNYQEAHTKINLSATYNHPDDRWSLSGYVRNLTNYADKVGYSSRGDTRLGTPRTYGAVLSVRF
jgi:iron complex outermembrane receptor protein